MKLIDGPITREELRQIAKASFGNFVKAVIDVSKDVMAIDADLHADEETYLLSHGSKQSDLWGINLYPDLKGESFIEFDSMINVRPSTNNLSRGVENAKTREKIKQVINELIL